MHQDNGTSDHSTFLGYIFWIFGFIGLHRFYFGKPISGAIWAPDEMADLLLASE